MLNRTEIERLHQHVSDHLIMQSDVPCPTRYEITVMPSAIGATYDVKCLDHDYPKVDITDYYSH